MALDSMPVGWQAGVQRENELDDDAIDAQIAAAEAYLDRLRKLQATRSCPPPSRDRAALELYPWQQDALQDWRQRRYRGVVQAVTGAGKTWVGIAAIESAERIGLRAVVLVPTRVLVAQWVTNLNRALPQFKVSTKIGDIRPWDVMVTTVQSAMNRPVLKRSEHGLLVADECHRYGAEKFSQALRPEYERRLGLTATLKRDDDGDQILEEYFGGICHNLGYKRALDEELISPYKFAYVSVPLSARERTEYDDAQDRLTAARRSLVANYDIPEEPFGEFHAAVSRLAGVEVREARSYLFHFSRRQGLLAGTRMKFLALAGLSPAVRASNGTIVFTQTQDASRNAAEALEVTGCPAAAIYSELDDEEREDRMEKFRTQQTTAISAPRILDEGVDVPEADLGIIMAANRGRRQTIQRLGRVLRRRPGKVAKFVIMYAGGTVEDPFAGSELPDFYKECIPYAEDFDTFDLRSDGLTALLQFLGASEDPLNELAQHDITRAASGGGDFEVVSTDDGDSSDDGTQGEDLDADEESRVVQDEDDDAEDVTERTYLPLTTAHLYRLYNFASSAHQHLASVKYSLKGGILAACLTGDAAEHYIDKETGLEELDLMLLYRNTAAKKPLATDTLLSYDFGASDLGRHPDEDPAVFTGRRINVRARALSLGDADPDDAVRAWLRSQSKPTTGLPARAVIVWPRKYVGKTIR